MLVVVLAGGGAMVIGAMAATAVALFEGDVARRRDALRVLRTVLGISTSAGVVAVVKLHEAGGL